jgi:hypothetical protein
MQELGLPARIVAVLHSETLFSRASQILSNCDMSACLEKIRELLP